jgi:hypothetical protein
VVERGWEQQAVARQSRASAMATEEVVSWEMQKNAKFSDLILADMEKLNANANVSKLRIFRWY